MRLVSPAKQREKTMKKNIQIISLILAITFSSATVNYAQFGNILNKAKEAIDKKKDKKKQDEQTANPPATGQPTTNEQTTTEPIDESPSGLRKSVQRDLLKVIPSDLGKIYFSNQPFTTNHDGGKTSFTSGEYVYGRLELNNGTLRDVLKFSPITTENPDHKLVYNLYLYGITDGVVIKEDSVMTPVNSPSVTLTESDLDKTYWNFDVLPEPSKATTNVSFDGPEKFYKFLIGYSKEQTYTIRLQLQKQSRDFRGNLEDYSKWQNIEGRATFDFKGTDFARLKSDSIQMENNKKQSYEKAKEDSINAENLVRELPKQWTEKTNPLLPIATEAQLRAMYLNLFAINDRPNIKIIKLHASAPRQTSWTVESNELGIPGYRYSNQWYTVFIKNSANNHCFFDSFGLRQNYSGGGTYSQTFLDSNSDSQKFFVCDKMTAK